MSTQLSLRPVPEPSEHRVEALAGVLAGFQWPGRESFAQLTKPQQRLALTVAREALLYLAAEPGEILL